MLFRMKYRVGNGRRMVTMMTINDVYNFKSPLFLLNLLFIPTNCFFHELLSDFFSCYSDDYLDERLHCFSVELKIDSLISFDDGFDFSIQCQHMIVYFASGFNRKSINIICI